MNLLKNALLSACLAAVFMFFESACGINYSGKTEVIVSTGTISAGGSLYGVLKMEGISDPEIYNVSRTLNSVFNLAKKSKKTDKYELTRTTANVFVSLKYREDTLNYYVVERSTSDGLSVRKERAELKKITMGSSGEIRTSLWDSMSRQGISPDIILSFADIFSWSIDFLTEPRVGDTYKVTWARSVTAEGAVFEEKILAAEYFGQESGRFTAVRFNNEYYDLAGKSLRKQFLKAPLNFRRISSFFSRRRFHPILKYYRPHLGIDYSAPSGTPVSSIGDGSVVFCGWKGGFGRLVIIRHNAVYTSTYGHLSRYGKGIRTGKRVAQGQVIGYVGASGLATGPHLDFRIQQYGKYINFLKLKFPPAGGVEQKDLEAFEQAKKEELGRLSAVSTGKDSSPSQIQ